MRFAQFLGSAALLAALATIVWCLRSPAVPPTAGSEGDRAAAESAPSPAEPAADAGAANAHKAATTAVGSLLQRVDGSIPRNVHQVRVCDAHRLPVEGAEVRWRDEQGVVLATTSTDEDGMSGCPIAAATAQAFHPACGASARKKLDTRVLRLDLVMPLESLDALPEPEEPPATSDPLAREREDERFLLRSERAMQHAADGIEVDILVTDAVGTPLPAALVSELRGRRSDPRSTAANLGRTDAAGLVRVRLSPGELWLKATVADNVARVPLTAVSACAGMAPTLHLVAATTVEVRGTVQDVAEVPQRLRRITVRGTAAPWLETEFGVPLSEEGDFVARLPAGEWLCVGAGWLPERDRIRTSDGQVRLACRSAVVVTVLRADGSPTVRAFAVAAERPNPGKRSGNRGAATPNGWPLHRLVLSTDLADSRVVVGDEHRPGELAMLELAERPEGALVVRLQPTASLVVVPMYRGQLTRGLDIELSVPGFRYVERCHGADGAVFPHAPTGTVTLAVLRAGRVLVEQQVELRAGGTQRLEPVVTL